MKHSCLNKYLSFTVREALIQPYISQMSMVQEGLQDIQHAGHLGEDEDSPALRLQLVQQDSQRLQLTYTHTNIHTLHPET